MNAMRVEDLKDIIDHLPADAKVVTVRSDFAEGTDTIWSVGKGVLWDEERNEVVLELDQPLRTEEF